MRYALPFQTATTVPGSASAIERSPESSRRYASVPRRTPVVDCPRYAESYQTPSFRSNVLPLTLRTLLESYRRASAFGVRSPSRDGAAAAGGAAAGISFIKLFAERFFAC